MRLIGGIVFFILFLFWILFRMIVKKDLKKHLPEFYGGLIFTGIWALIYFFIFS